MSGPAFARPRCICRCSKEIPSARELIVIYQNNRLIISGSEECQEDAEQQTGSESPIREEDERSSSKFRVGTLRSHLFPPTIATARLVTTILMYTSDGQVLHITVKDCSVYTGWL